LSLFCIHKDTSLNLLKLVLKYGITLLLLLGYSQLFAFADSSHNHPTLSASEPGSFNHYQREAPKAVKLEIVYIEERIETDDDDFFTLVGQDIDQHQSRTFAFQEHFLHHAGNNKLSGYSCQSPSTVRSPHPVLCVFRL